MTGAQQAFRLPSGGMIDRSRRLSFVFDGASFSGYEGDTLASALLANGVRVVARSFKYHRPRGTFTAGSEEPNALVSVGSGDRTTPNTRATQVWLRDGLQAASQNRWPSLRWDVGAASGLLSPLLAAGFYYKTFMWPRRLWPAYERAIRQMAGMGKAPRLPDPDHYDRHYRSCDCLVVGLGPAGIAAALAASRATNQSLIVLDADRLAGGSLLFNKALVDGLPGFQWARQALQELASRQNVTVLLNTTAFGYYDDNLVAAIEQCGPGDSHGPRERVHLIRARRVILATGAHERPVVFPGNDRPGIMLASAARAYLNRFGVAPGRRVVILTNNDSAYPLATELAAQGVDVPALLDMRTGAAHETHVPVRSGCIVTDTMGRRGLRAIRIRSIDGRKDFSEAIDCDALLVSGGWSPVVQLHLQAQGGIQFDASLQAFVPRDSRQAHVSAGAAAGAIDTSAALQQGWLAGGGSGTPPASDDRGASADRHSGTVHASVRDRARARAFVDLQNDVTVRDITQAVSEGFDSVEHLKRYTTLGMGTDQGKTSSFNGLRLLAEATARPIQSFGVTTARPPFVPITFGALAGHHRGRLFAPTRRSALHDRHTDGGAVWGDAGLWLRPRSYPRPGESLQESIDREVRAVRTSVGMVDVSTLGKIDIQGSDAIELLERVYCNGFRSLDVGRTRYGLMLREDGIVLDDGTTSRLGPQHYFMTTSTAHASKVMSHLEHCLQVLWPTLDVHVTSVTEQWSAIAVAGPQSRAVLEFLLETDLGNSELPYLGVREVQFRGERSRLLRVSFSGELAYEIYVPADLGPEVWNRLLDAGGRYGMVPYGTDALTVLRVEKGHVAGPEIDGRTTPKDLGLDRLRSSGKFYIGRQLADRIALRDPLRPTLVGLVALEPDASLRSGSQLVSPDARVESLGHTTTAVHSATLGRSIALAFLSSGNTRRGAELLALDLLRNETQRVRVVDTVFVDPQGVRLRA